MDHRDSGLEGLHVFGAVVLGGGLGHLEIVKDGQQLEYGVDHRLYDGAGLRTLLHDAGFESVALYGDLDGRTYDTSARRLVAVARKASV